MVPQEWASPTGLRNLVALSLAGNSLTGALLHVPIPDAHDGPMHCILVPSTRSKLLRALEPLLWISQTVQTSLGMG